MLKYWPFEKKYLLICGAVLLTLVSYLLAVKNTLAAWEVNKQLKSQLAQGTDLSYDSEYLDRKNQNLDRLIARYKVDTAIFRSSMLSNISVLAETNHARLVDAPVNDAAFRTENYMVQKLSFEGNFFDLNKLLNQIERNDRVGVMRALEFRMVEQRAGIEEFKKLQLVVYLENAMK